MKLKLYTLISFVIIGLHSIAQSIVINGTILSNAGGGPNNCNANSYKMKGTASGSGSCVSLTSNTFDAGGVWVCDPINLNQSFKVYFEANFDNINSGDGLAFVLQAEGVPSFLGGEGGGLGYSYGNLNGCIPFGDCLLDPSVAVEFDIWDNSADVWNVGNPGLGNINDMACDHASIQVDSDQTASGTLAGPACLLSGGVDVTDGLNHDVCIIWDVVNLEYSVYLDSALVTMYSGDIRTNFVDPTMVYWGVTGGSGGAAVSMQVCNVDMLTNVVNPTCTCAIPHVITTPNPEEICSGETTNVTLTSSEPATTYSWVATDNANVTGESLTPQSGALIAETLTNISAVEQTVTYTITPTAGCVGPDSILTVVVYPIPTISGTLNVCTGSTTTLTGSGTPNAITPWVSSNPGVATVNASGVVTGVSAGTTDIAYMNNGGCITTETVTVDALPTASISYSGTPFCSGVVSGSVTLTGTGAYTGGTYSSTAGLSINAATGEINPSTSTPGNYTVTYTVPANGVCTSFDVTTTVDITEAPTASISYAGTPFCSTEISGSVTLTGTGAYTGGTYSSTAGLSINAATGEINPSTSTPGNYTVTYTVPASGGCPTIDVTTTIDIYASPVITATAIDPTVCNGSDGSIDVNLTSGSSSTGTVFWSGTSSGSNGIIDISAATPPYDINQVLTAGTYDVYFVDANGCQSNTITGVSLVNPGAPIIDPISDMESCNTNIVLDNNNITGINLTGGQDYYFGSLGTGGSANGQTFTTANTPVTIYAYDNDGTCDVEVVFTITVYENPTAGISYAGTPFCSTEISGSVTLTGTGAYTGGTYSSTAGLSINAATGEINPSTSTPGNYTVTYTVPASGGCPTIDVTTTVDITEAPTASISYAGTPFCSSVVSGSVTLTGTGAYTGGTYSSTVGLTINVTTGEVDPTTSTTGTYTITYTIPASGGCPTDIATTSITIVATPDINPIGPITGCGSYTLPQITGTDITNGAAYYDAMGGMGTMFSEGEVITASITLYAYDGAVGCSDEEVLEITINALPTAVISGGGTYCEGENPTDVVVELTGAQPWIINYTIDGGATQTINGSSTPISLGNIAGVYSLETVADANCVDSISGLTEITINPLPPSPIAEGGAEYCSSVIPEELTASGTGGTFDWFDDPGLTNNIGTGPTLSPYSFVGTTTYYVVETFNGCTGSATSVVITINDCDLIIPTAITPNSDQINDSWEIQNLDMSYPNNVVSIYNRWGSLIYQHISDSGSNPYSQNQWDGTYQGELLPVGSYYYIIELNDDKQSNKTGAVSIIAE